MASIADSTSITQSGRKDPPLSVLSRSRRHFQNDADRYDSSTMGLIAWKLGPPPGVIPGPPPPPPPPPGGHPPPPPPLPTDPPGDWPRSVAEEKRHRMALARVRLNALARQRLAAAERQQQLNRRLYVVDVEAQLRVSRAAGQEDFFVVLDWVEAMKR